MIVAEALMIVGLACVVILVGAISFKFGKLFKKDTK
jgi:hypothetical protein